MILNELLGTIQSNLTPYLRDMNSYLDTQKQVLTFKMISKRPISFEKISQNDFLNNIFKKVFVFSEEDLSNLVSKDLYYFSGKNNSHKIIIKKEGMLLVEFSENEDFSKKHILAHSSIGSYPFDSHFSISRYNSSQNIKKNDQEKKYKTFYLRFSGFTPIEEIFSYNSAAHKIFDSQTSYLERLFQELDYIESCHLSGKYRASKKLLKYIEDIRNFFTQQTYRDMYSKIDIIALYYLIQTLKYSNGIMGRNHSLFSGKRIGANFKRTLEKDVDNCIKLAKKIAKFEPVNILRIVSPNSGMYIEAVHK